MKAQVLHDIGKIQYEDAPLPELSTGQVLVKVKAAGICGSDIPRIYETGAHCHPIIPGHEFSGEVAEIGPEVEASLLGKRVGVFPLIPCGKCGPCRDKKYEMCRSYNYLGSRSDGGFAEYVAVPKWNLIELPDSVTYEQSAMLEPMAVAAHAMRRTLELDKISRDKSVAVCGLGTIGLLLTMFLINEGFDNLYLLGNKQSQKEAIGLLGVADERFCDTKKEDASNWLMSRTDNAGVDVFFECVGKSETMQLAVDMTSPAGMVMLVGNPHSDMSLDKQVYWKILRNQLTIKGTWNSSYTTEQTDDWHYVIGLLESGRIRPERFITHRYVLADLQNGFEIMRDKSEDFIKIMCVEK